MLISGVGIAYFSAFIPRYVGGLLFGVGSGAAMIPYAMIKEANPDNVKGSATGAMNFLVFSLSAFLAPVFGLALMRFPAARRSLSRIFTTPTSSGSEQSFSLSF